MFSYLRTPGFWFGIAIAIGVIWLLRTYVPAYAALTGIADFAADVLIIIIVSSLAEWLYKRISK